MTVSETTTTVSRDLTRADSGGDKPDGKHTPLPAARGGPTTIVVGLDDSATARRATAYAIGLARSSRARLVFVQVLNTATLLGLAPAALPAAEEAAEQVAQELRDELTAALAGSGVEWTVRRSSGNPYVELTTVAKQERADTVVVGASQRAGHRLIGSLPVHLVKTHHWPVVVVP